MMQSQIYLSSSSQRRQELLDQIGVRYRVIHPQIDESPRPDETGSDYVRRLAFEKAEAGAMLIKQQSKIPILGADTCVISEGDFLGKPENYTEYNAMMRRLSGKSHKVLTAVAVIDAGEWALVKQTIGATAQSRQEDYKNKHLRLCVTKVTFRDLSASECRDYWESGEPKGKAGGYAIQGKGAMFIKNIEGSYSGVVGLPLFETSELLQQQAVEMFAINGDKI